MTPDNMRLLPLSRDEIAATITRWHADWPGMGVLALLPEAEHERLPLLQAVCREQGVPLVGGIFPALVTATGLTQSGAWLLRFDSMVPAFVVERLSADPAAAAERIARDLTAALDEPGRVLGPHPTLYLFVDALFQNTATMLDGLYLSLADRVNYAGVAAGSESFQPMPCLFDGEHVIGDGALAMLLPGDVKTILEHGYRTPERVMTATATEGNRVISIDWQPAFDIYRDIIRTECGIDLTRDNFYQWAVHSPLGILRANGEIVVRIPVALTEDGSMYCIGEVPENAMLVVLRSPGPSDGHCVQRLGEGLAVANGPLQADNLLVFYCAGRRLHLGERAQVELDELRDSTHARGIAGALSLGELGSTKAGGYPLFHNATLVCTPWREA